MAEKPQLSVVIPVYNGERYLGKMLDSVLTQTLSDFELFLVDNASTDKTGQLMHTYAERDGRVRCLYQEKPGVSAARNAALEICEGAYVMFLDGDDWIDENYFEMFVAAMEGVDLVSAGYRAYHEERIDGKTHYTCFYESPKEGNEDFTAERMLERLFEIRHYQGYVWNKCFRMEIIRQHRLRFHEDISYNEDRLFAVEYLACARRARMLGENRYHYILHEGNAVSAEYGEFPQEKEFTEIEAFSRMLPYLADYPRALALARKNMAQRELLLFGRMIDPHGFARYRKSRFRYHARRFRRLGYLPEDEREKKLCRKLIWYGWTGICYGQKEQMD